MRTLAPIHRYIWKYKRLFILGFICVTISNIMAIFTPMVVRNAIDEVAIKLNIYQLTSNPELQTGIAWSITKMLLAFAGLVLLFSLLRGLFMFFMRQTLVVLSRKVEFELRNDLFHHIQSLTLSFFRRNKTGDLMARVTEDIGRVRMYAGPAIMYIMNTVTMLIIVVITMLYVNPELTLYTLLPLPILSLVIYFVETKINERSDQIQQQLSDLNSYSQEVYSGVRLTKSYVREKDFSARFQAESEKYKSRSMRLVKLNSLFQPSVMLLVGLSTVLTIWIGAEKVVDGSITVGNIAEFVLYVNLLIWPIIAIGWATTLVQRGAASQARINEIMDARPEIQFPDQGPEIKQARVKFDNVSYKYEHTGIQALKDVSFELEPGMKLGILGATGSGKSTFCNLVPRLLDPDSGTISIDGRPLQTYTREQLRESIGYTPQDVFLFSESIRDNIAFGKPGATEEEVIEAARNAAIYDNVMQDFPQGFDTIVGERGVTLSGGQKQRTALARAWIRKPKLLVLDDCLSAVDTRTEEEVLRNLRKARAENPDMAVIMIAHRVSAIQDANLILVLDGGRVKESGTHAELVKQGGYYATIYRKQLMEAEMAQAR